MARIMPGAYAEKMEDLAVYCIISPFDKTVYINKTGAHRLRKAYTEHHCERVTKTATLFKKAKAEKNLPPMYLLESQHMSQRVAFQHCVAWMKYFFDHGYTQVTEDIFTEYANDLTPHTQEIYDGIKDIPLAEKLMPLGGIFPNYNVRKDNATYTPQVSFTLTNEEYNKIKQESIVAGLSMRAYCKKMALCGRIIRIGFKDIDDYLHEFRELKELVKAILYTIYKTKKYYPADLKNIQDCVDSLTATYKKVNEDFVNLISSLH